MKFTRPALTVLTSVILAGVVACGEDEVVTDNGDLNRPQSSELAGDDNQPAGIGQNPATATTEPAGQTGAQPNVTGVQQNQLGNQNLADARQSDLSFEEMESGVIPDELIDEGSGLNRLAIARMEPVAGSQTSGLVSFIETEGEEGIRIVARMMNLPAGEHGFHIHENGDCSAPDASSAGEHFNPAGESHAGPDADERHAGDLGNIMAMNEEASLDIMDEQLSFDGMNSVVGKAIVVHAGEDDLASQPSGNSGDPLACGVIGLRDVSDLTRN